MKELVWMIKIENGVVKLYDGSYRYDYWEVIGPDPLDETINRSEFKTIVFTADNGEIPEIGDFIEGTKLVKRTVIQVTEGRMRWPAEYKPDNGWWSEHTADEDWRR